MNRHQYRSFRPASNFPGKGNMPAATPLKLGDDILSAVSDYLQSRGVSGQFRDLLNVNDLEQTVISAIALERAYSLVFYIENTYMMGLELDYMVERKRELLAKSPPSMQYRALYKAIMDRSSCHVEAIDAVSCRNAHTRCKEYLLEFVGCLEISTLNGHSQVQPRCKFVHHDLLLKNAGHPEGSSLVGLWCPVLGMIDRDCVPYKT